jgi:hypothetical protein
VTFLVRIQYRAIAVVTSQQMDCMQFPATDVNVREILSDTRIANGAAMKTLVTYKYPRMR